MADRFNYDGDKSFEPIIVEAMDDLNQWEEYVQVYWFETDDEKQDLGEFHLECVKGVTEGDERQSKGSFEWIRHTCNEYRDEYKSGVWFDSLGLAPSILFLAKVFPPQPRTEEDKYWYDHEKEKVEHGVSAYAVIASKNHTNNLQRVYVGQLWQRIHLYATAIGIGMQPINQMLERRDIELYDECAGNACSDTNKLIELMETKNASASIMDINQPLFAFRAGYNVDPDNNPLFKAARRSRDTVTTYE